MIRAKGVKHVARFWLKDPGDAPQIERRIEQLAGIPQVIDLIVGPPLDSDWGRQIDKSYDLAFVMTFRDLEDCRTYFLDDLHQRLAGELERIAERIEAFYVEY
jgi:hypothetical protein